MSIDSVAGVSLFIRSKYSGAPHDVLSVRPKLGEQLDPGVEAALTHDGEWRAEVGWASVRVRPRLQEQPSVRLNILSSQLC